jgi:hypothetical protein
VIDPSAPVRSRRSGAAARDYLQRAPSRPPEDLTLRYLCMVYNEEKMLNAMPRSEFQALVSAHLAYDDELRRSGHYLESAALEEEHAATIVRVRNGKMSVTDGPFAETKEQLGGFYLIEARDLNEAIQVASKIPSARTGSIEVRPVKELT